MKKGFTLAEVLITLGVIGVVAAITMPTLIAKYQEHVTVNKVKKFYTMMSQAVLLSINDNGYPPEWNSDKFYDYIRPYLKIVKDCKNINGCLGYDDGMYKLDNTLQAKYDNYGKNMYKYILSDGSYIWMRKSDPYCRANDFATTGDVCGLIWFDINGNKKPNTFGRDIFLLYVSPTGVKSISNNTCYKDSQGSSCLTWILQNGNMNYPATKSNNE